MSEYISTMNNCSIRNVSRGLLFSKASVSVTFNEKLDATYNVLPRGIKILHKNFKRKLSSIFKDVLEISKVLNRCWLTVYVFPQLVLTGMKNSEVF